MTTLEVKHLSRDYMVTAREVVDPIEEEDVVNIKKEAVETEENAQTEENAETAVIVDLEVVVSAMIENLRWMNSMNKISFPRKK